MRQDHHWAGIASLRLHAAEVIPGFAQLLIHCENSEPDVLAGSFVAGGANSPLVAGAAVELLLPGECVGRVVLGEGGDGAISLQGVLPWPSWRRLTDEPGGPDENVHAIQHPGYLEVRAGARITERNWVPGEALDLQHGQRLLMDYRQVTEILTSPERFAEAASEIDRLGIRLAMVGSGALVLGMRRQAARLADVAASANVRMFRDYDEARLWLLE